MTQSNNDTDYNYNENYTDDSRMSRIYKHRTHEEWFEWMNEREDEFPKKTYEEVLGELEDSLVSNIKHVEKLEYFKEETPVKIKNLGVFQGPKDVWTDHDEIRLYKEKIGTKKVQLELLKSVKHDLVK